MARSNKTRYAILGMLTIGPQSGYDIKKRIDVSIGHFWNESFGQIYPMLKRLVEGGLATQEVEEQRGKPDRKVYELTPKGLEELRNWLAEPIQEWSHVRNEALFKLFFGRQIPVEATRNHIVRYHQDQLQAQKRYQEIERVLNGEYRDFPDLPYWKMTLQAGQAITAARIQWCEDTLAALRELEESHASDASESSHGNSS